MSKAKRVFAGAINPKNAVAYVQGMRNDFGDKFTIFLTAFYIGVRGVIWDFIPTIHLPYYQYGGWNSAENQRYYQIARVPWSAKSFGGVITDIIPIFGYEKSSYFVIYTIIGSISIIVLASFQFNKGQHSEVIPTLLFLFLSLQVAFTDVLVQGKYADLMKNSSNNRGNAISFSYFCSIIGTILPTATVGPMSDAMAPRYILFIALPFAIQPLFFIFTGCMIDDKAAPERNNKIDVEKFVKQGRVMIMGISMGVVGIGSVLVALMGSTLVIFLYNVICAFALGTLLIFTTPRTIAFCLIYVCCAMCFYIDISGPVDYYYTEPCVENGPHFSMTYYKTTVGFLGFVGELAGIWLYQSILCHYKFRLIFWSTTVIKVVASIFDIIIMTRFNQTIGIPDKVMYLFGSSIIYRAAYQMDYMPSALICAKVCPRKIETTIFALAASYGNYGSAVSSYIGLYLADIFNVKIEPNGGICSYDNLVTLVIICHFLLPLITIPLTFVLIPDKYVYEDIADISFQNSKYYYIDPTIPKQYIYTTSK